MKGKGYIIAALIGFVAMLIGMMFVNPDNTKSMLLGFGIMAAGTTICITSLGLAKSKGVDLES